MKMAQKRDDGVFSEQETSRRRDEVIRRMANTPPRPKIKSPRRQRNEKKAGADRVADKGRVRRES
jgi:hypothetical protein